MKIVEIREVTKPIKSNIRNAYIDFSKMTLSLVAVVTDVVRDGRPVIGYGFNSNGRYGQGSLMRERFIPRVLEADPSTVIDEANDNLDPHKLWATMMTNEKPGGHGERSVAVGTIDMAIWDARREDRRPAAVPAARRALRQRHAEPPRLRLRGRRLLLARPGHRRPDARDAGLSRSRLHRSSRRRSAARRSTRIASASRPC